MEVIDLSLDGLKLITPRRFDDARGFFQQIYHREHYVAAGIENDFIQDNWSRSTKGVLRGLHYQYEHCQAKLVGVMRGEVFDVAVDMRKDSPTFGQWESILLTGDNGHQLFVPRGFAHGFMVLSDTVDFIYKCDDLYTPGDEYGVMWNDPEIGIHWPEGIDPIVSDKDQVLPSFADAKYF